MTERSPLSALTGFAHDIRHYAPRDPTETAHLARFRALLERGPDVLDRQHFAPGHLTASAFILAPDSDDVLLIHHAKLLRWLQPGGHVERTDVSLVDAARREAAEEVGMTSLAQLGEGVFDLDIHIIPARKSEPAHEHFDVRYLFRAPSRVFAAASDALAARFVPLSELTVAISDESVVRALSKLRAR